MFYKYSKHNREDWVVLVLKPSILWELDCAFCQENAASNNVTSIPLSIRKQANALRKMFADYGDIRREDTKIPNSYPTHPQAEVLVFNPITPKYIDEVHFYSLISAQKWLNCYQGHEQNFYYGKHPFSPRRDYQVWSLTR